jgi:hypothetical protein
MERGSGVKDAGGEGLPGCTSDALGARKLGRGHASRRWESLTPRGLHPRFFAREGERGCPPSAGPKRSGARKHSVAWMATCQDNRRNGILDTVAVDEELERQELIRINTVPSFHTRSRTDGQNARKPATRANFKRTACVIHAIMYSSKRF